MIKRLLFIIIVANLQLLNQKLKLIIYIRIFIKIHNQQNRRLVYKTYRIVKFEKLLILRVKNPLNLKSQQFYKISKVL